MLPSAQEEEVDVDEFPVDPDVSCCLLIKFYLFCSLNFVFFLLQSEEGKAQEASKKEFQQTEKLKNLFSDCNIFLSREVPREILVFVLRYKWHICTYSSAFMCEHPFQTSKILKSVFPTKHRCWKFLQMTTTAACGNCVLKKRLYSPDFSSHSPSSKPFFLLFAWKFLWKFLFP